MLRRATPTSPRDARLAATLRRTQTVLQDSISTQPAASAVLRQSSPLSPRATSPFIAALASKREEDPSNQVSLFLTPYSPVKARGLWCFFDNITNGASRFSFSTFCDIFPFIA